MIYIIIIYVITFHKFVIIDTNDLNLTIINPLDLNNGINYLNVKLLLKQKNWTVLYINMNLHTNK